MESSYYAVRWLFLRALGLVYFLAFASLSVQILGLVGHNGISPADAYISWAQGNLGAERYWDLPTLFWLSPSDACLMILTVGGAVLSIPLVLGIATAPLLAVLWLFYLSLSTIGGDFLSFQWDSLLLETGFLSIFFAPWQLFAAPWKQAATEPPAPRVMLWLLRFLLFRLVFMSGAVKLLSGDQTWRNLTALNFHYTTQPLPTPIAWYAAQLPEWFQKFSVLSMFGLELIVPLMIAGTRGMRITGAALICLLQFLIALTGNYTFFNLLAVFLCILLLDDRLLMRIIPPKLFAQIMPSSPIKRPVLQNILIWPVVFTLSVLSVTQVSESFAGSNNVPPVATEMLSLLSPLRIVNGYGVFAVMTTKRMEIIVEGSNDGQNWAEYEFKYKPGNLKRPPPWVAPHQPRLDWQMWFAALGDFQENRWFVNFIVQLLKGSPQVLALLDKNPFPDKAPTYIRALLYEYHFTSIAQRAKTGDWWKRDYQGIYFPTASLNSTPESPGSIP